MRAAKELIKRQWIHVHNLENDELTSDRLPRFRIKSPHVKTQVEDFPLVLLTPEKRDKFKLQAEKSREAPDLFDESKEDESSSIEDKSITSSEDENIEEASVQESQEAEQE